MRSTSDPRRAVILTSYRTGAPRGKNLGVPGYSYDLVAQLFVPLLARWGEVVPVVRDAEAVESAVQDARRPRSQDPYLGTRTVRGQATRQAAWARRGGRRTRRSHRRRR